MVVLVVPTLLAVAESDEYDVHVTLSAAQNSVQPARFVLEWHHASWWRSRRHVAAERQHSARTL